MNSNDSITRIKQNDSNCVVNQAKIKPPSVNNFYQAGFRLFLFDVTQGFINGSRYESKRGDDLYLCIPFYRWITAHEGTLQFNSNDSMYKY